MSTTIEQRVGIIESLEKGEQQWKISERLRVRPRTIRKWHQRYREGGRAGLDSEMGRPVKGSMSSYSPEIQETIRSWRQNNPGWGPSTLRAELENHEAFQGEKLPSRRTIARFLSEEGLIAKKEKSATLPESAKVTGKHAHEVWEMDARGYERIPDVGFISLINLNDRFSHARLLSYPCYLGSNRVERHAKTDDYQSALRIAFLKWGLPAIIQVDHESVFYDNRTLSPFPTRFHLWLIALGIRLTFIEPRRPTQQAMTERSHQLWYHQVIQGHTFSDWDSLFHALESRRYFLNHCLPSGPTDNQPPLVTHPDALHSGKEYCLLHEKEMLSLQRIYHYLAQGRWFRSVSQNGTLSLGGVSYYIGPKWYKHQAEITFRLSDLSLLFHDDSGKFIDAKPIHNISTSFLMGDFYDYSHFPAYQLPIPFEWEQQQMARLFGTLS